MAKTSKQPPKQMTYASSGVDIEAGDRMVDMIRRHTARTYGPRVLGKHDGFAGCFRLDHSRLFKRNYKQPLLVSCTDGVGTKVKLAGQMNIYDTVGQDLVAMSVNDLIVQGAEPLFFLDYLAVNKLDPQLCTDMVKGVSDGCVLAGCALLGGETAEMPDVYKPGDFDMAGFAVGVCELKGIIDGKKAKQGDVILGLSSSGIHSNGYSLVRAIVKQKKLKLDKIYPELDPTKTLGRVLLEPTKIYAQAVMALLDHFGKKTAVTAMSHITGSGLPGNVPRTFGTHLNARLDKKAWTPPAVFGFLQSKGNVAETEMFNVFNMGIGYTIAVRKNAVDDAIKVLAKAGEKATVIGKLVPGKGEVEWA